jgi:prepilin-type N-terminal cleavage/methylation domain-containing protein
MSHFFTKKGFRGFTLIELLVVIAIIGLLSTIIAAPIQNARKKAKDAKKIAELKSTILAIEQYAEANNNNYPATLGDLVPTYMPILSSYAGTGVPVRDRFAYVTYTSTPDGSTVAQRFGYHMAVKLDVYNNDVLSNDRDCSGAVAGATITGTNCASFNSATVPTVDYTNWASGMICGNNTVPAAGVTPPAGTCTAGGTADIGVLTEGATSTCQAVNDCVYDVTNQLN